MQRICGRCSAPFDAEILKRTPGRGGSYPRFCSTECRLAHASDRRRKGMAEIPCEWCGSVFSRPGKSRQVTCSDECSRLRANARARARQLAERRAARAAGCRRCSVPVWGRKKLLCAACCATAERDRQRRRSLHRRGVQASREFTFDEIAERDGWRCHICGDPVDRDLRGVQRMVGSIDHLVPISAGGLDTRENVALAHFGCNSRRGARPLRAAA